MDGTTDESLAAKVAAAEYNARILSLEEYPLCPWRGHPRVDGIVWPYNEKAPDPSELGCAIETERLGGSWHNIPTSAGVNKWGLEDCGESAILQRFGGGRRYRVSIRWSGNTLPGSMVYHNLGENQTPPRPVPGLQRELDTALATRGETGLAPPELNPSMARAPSEPLPEGEESFQSLARLLAMQHNNPGMAFLSMALEGLAPESRITVAGLIYVIQEQKATLTATQQFTLEVVRSLTTGRNAPPDVTAIWREMASEEKARAQALAAKVETLKENQNGGPPPQPFAQKLIEKAVEVGLPAVIRQLPPDVLSQAVQGAAQAAGGVK